MTNRNSGVRTELSKSNIRVALFVALVLTGGVATLLMPVVSAQGSTSTINTGVANVSIVSGAKNQDNGLFYSPANITVVLGVNNTVVWTNHDSTNHTVVALDNSYSAVLTPGQTFTHTFTVPGVYKYHCTIHLWMTGSVTVLAAPSSSSSSSTSTSSSTGAVPEFPFEAVALVVITALVIVSYLFVRQPRRG